MSKEIDFRNLRQASELENITENTKVVVLEDGITKQTDASNFIKEDELPAVTSDDNGDVLTVVEGAWAKATPPGGNNDFVVTYTATEDEQTQEMVITADKTYAELVTAFSAGKNIVARTPNGEGGFLICTCIEATTSNEGYFKFVNISNSDSVIYSTTIEHNQSDSITLNSVMVSGN